MTCATNVSNILTDHFPEIFRYWQSEFIEPCANNELERPHGEVRWMTILNEIVPILRGYRDPDPAFDTKLQIKKIKTHENWSVETTWSA